MAPPQTEGVLSGGGGGGGADVVIDAATIDTSEDASKDPIYICLHQIF